MQQLTKSFGSFTWAMSLFGMQQALNMTRMPQAGSQTSPATDAFNAITHAAVGQLGETARKSFDAADQFQKQLIDASFSLFSRGAARDDAGSATPGTSMGDFMRRMSAPFRSCADAPAAKPRDAETQQGWGPVPPS